LHSGRGILTIVVFVLFAAVFADGLRASSGLPERLVTVVAAAGVAVLVFGGPSRMRNPPVRTRRAKSEP
jgi:hypothetical protein